MAGETPRRRGTLVPQQLRRRRKAREGRRELWEICRSQSIDFLSSTPHDRMTGANSSTPARAGHPDMATAQQQGSCWTRYHSWRTSTHRPAYVRWRCCARQSAGKTPSRRRGLARAISEAILIGGELADPRSDAASTEMPDFVPNVPEGHATRRPSFETLFVTLQPPSRWPALAEMCAGCAAATTSSSTSQSSWARSRTRSARPSSTRGSPRS